MKNLRELNLTDEELKLIIDGLGELPNKGEVGSMIGDLMMNMLSDKEMDSSMKLKMENERDERRRKDKLKKEQLSDKVKILQGKLLQFKNSFKSDDLPPMKELVESK